MSVLPECKMLKLIVVMAFDRDAAGELQTVFGPVEQMSDERAVRAARRWRRSTPG